MELENYIAEITDVEDGIFCISLVSDPATEHNWVLFKEDKAIERFSVINEDEHLLSGVIMIPDYPIYRRDGEREFYITFRADTIKAMAEKMLADNTQNQIDIQHNGNLVDGVQLVELFIKDTQKGINPVYLENVPDGSLIGTYKVHNEEIWEAAKRGDIKGFSLAGMFQLSEENEIEEVLKMLSKIKRIR